MELKVTMCHSKLLYLLSKGEVFQNAVNSYQASAPAHSYEGVAGYIETKVVFQVKDLSLLSELMASWYKLPDSARSIWYSLAKGNNLCLR